MKTYSDLKFPTRTHHGHRSKRADLIQEACESFLDRFCRKSEKCVNRPPDEELDYIKELAGKHEINEMFLRKIIYGRTFNEIEA